MRQIMSSVIFAGGQTSAGNSAVRYCGLIVSLRKSDCPLKLYTYFADKRPPAIALSGIADRYFHSARATALIHL